VEKPISIFNIRSPFRYIKVHMPGCKRPTYIVPKPKEQS